MKTINKIFLSLILFFSLQHFSFGQQIGDLKGINYQAVAIDEDGKEIVGMDVSGKPLYEKAIGVRFTITKGLNGTVLYQETHTAQTDKYGLFSLVIGQGTLTSLSTYTKLLDMPWIEADQFLKVELATKNDGNFKLVSNQQFMSVPYSFYTDDIADDAITTAKILNDEVLSEDIKSETILAIDIATGAVETSEILDETILSGDIATSAVTTSEILDETIVAGDIATSAVETSEILDETILANDIATGAVTSSEILDETILANDIATGAVTSSEMLDGTILNEDIANATIDLTTKVTGVLPVQNGGTGVDGSTATDGQLLIGNGTGFQLNTLTAGTGINITNTPGGIQISSGVQGINSASAGNVIVNNIAAGATFISAAIPLTGVLPGNIVVGSCDKDLKGCMMTTYVSGNNKINVAIFNGTGAAINLGTVSVRVLVVQ